MTHPCGFREIEHTADWELQAWAPDYTQLLLTAAQGMYALAGMQLEPQPRYARQLLLHAVDREGLLVRWLSELLWLSEQEGLAFDKIGLQVDLEPGDSFRLQAQLEGAQISNLDKEIKAVTFHNLAVQESERGVEVSIVFDV